MKRVCNRVSVKSFVFLWGVTLLASCAKGVPLNEASKVHPMSPIPGNSSGWDIETRTASDLSVSYTKKEMPVEQQEQARHLYKATDLESIPVDPKFNVQLFKINNLKNSENTVFIAPKIFAYGSAEKGRIAPQRHSDGTVSLPFPLILTDASTKEIVSPDGKSKINLPDTLLIQDVGGLAVDLTRRMGAVQTLSVLPGCPKKIIVKVNSEEFDATPRDLATGDYCQMNAPFTANLRVSADEAQFILQKALYANAVEVRAVYETRVAFRVAHFELSFNKAKLFTDLEAELAVANNVWADVDLHAKVTNVVKKEAMKVQIQGEANQQLDAIVNQAISTFFEKYDPNPATGLKPCGTALVCARLNYNYSKQEENFQITWDQSSNAESGQNYITWTKLQPLLDKVVDIGNAPGRPTLRNNSSRSIETGLIVEPGDLLEITPTYLIKEERELGIPTRLRAENNVCTSSREIKRRECHWEHTGSGRGDGSGGDREICRDVHVGDECTNYENRWMDTTTYSMSAPAFTRLDQPIGQMQQIFDGLALRFTWSQDGNTSEKTCALNLFKREGDGKSLTVRLENQPNCEIFPQGQSVRPMVSLVNNISYKIKYTSGYDLNYWDGRSESHHSDSVYEPVVDFAGTVAIKGYDIGSSTSMGFPVR